MVLLETSLRASNKPYQQSIAAHVCCYKLRTFNKPFVSVFFKFLEYFIACLGLL